MHSNEKLIQKFYTSFQKKDWRTMQECYHSDIVFNDAVFKNFKEKEVKAMWHMLLSSSKDLALTFDSISANENTGKAHWIATYTFTKTGNIVINDIQANFEFKDGKIFRHTDKFDFYKWSSQALGWKGKLLGKFGFLNKKVSETAAKSLEKFMKLHPKKYL